MEELETIKKAVSDSTAAQQQQQQMEMEYRKAQEERRRKRGKGHMGNRPPVHHILPLRSVAPGPRPHAEPMDC